MQSPHTLRVLALSLGLLALPAFRATAQTPLRFWRNMQLTFAKLSVVARGKIFFIGMTSGKN